MILQKKRNKALDLWHLLFKLDLKLALSIDLQYTHHSRVYLCLRAFTISFHTMSQFIVCRRGFMMRIWIKIPDIAQPGFLMCKTAKWSNNKAMIFFQELFEMAPSWTESIKWSIDVIFIASWYQENGEGELFFQQLKLAVLWGNCNLPGLCSFPGTQQQVQALCSGV